MKQLLVLLLVSIGLAQSVHGQPSPVQPRLLINEFVASNSQGITDEDGDASDWIELYNAGTDTLRLAGFGISDDATQPMKWVFPNVSMAPNAFLLLWCSGKNRVQQELHTNFRISAAGEPLYVSDSMGVLLDSIGPMALPTDLSYGRQQDGDSLWGFFNGPTPGNSNNTAQAYTTLLQPLQLSHQSGFYNSPFQLSISSLDTGTQILYTLDGSEPDPANLGGRSFLYKQLFPEHPGDPVGDSLYESIASYAYQQAIHISDPSADSNRWSNMAATYNRLANHYPNQPIRKARVVRAKAFRPGALSAPTQSATYFVDSAQGRGRYALPVLSVATNPRHLHDYNIGLWTPGVDFDQWRASRPNEPVEQGMPANYHRTGEAWEYPVHFDYFETQQSQAVLSHTAGLRVHGGYGRALPRKAIRLYARNRYGESTFDHQLFPQQNYTSYKRLLFRNSDYGSTNTRDAIIQTFSDGLSFETQAYRPVILFVNGEYWGLIAQHERYDQHYFERKYGIVEAEIDLLASRQEVELGDTVHYAAMLAFMAQQQMSDSAAFAHLNTLMDVENFTDYWLANIYAGNEDWPHQNIRYWRKRVNYTPGAGQHDGRWRWLMFDIDWGLDPTSVRDHLFIQTSSQAAGSDRADWSTFIVRKLLENPGYRDYFVNRLLDLLNTSFHSDRTVGILDSLEQLLYPYIPEQIARWNELRWGPMQWLDNMNGARYVLQSRADTLRQSLERRFGLANPLLLRTGVNNIAMGTIKVNSLVLPDSVMPNDTTYWQGIYYQDVPLRFEAKPQGGYRFVRWEGLPDSLAPVQHWQVPFDTVSVRAIFEFDSSLLLPRESIHYWHFNNLPTGNLDTVWADQSGGEAGYLFYQGAGAGYMDRVNDGSLLNSQSQQTAGYALRVRNPSDSRSLIIHADTRWHRNLKLNYALSRTNNGATFQQISYRLSDTSAWQQLPLLITVQSTYALVEVDLSAYDVLNKQEKVSFKIAFTGPSAANTSGNNRIDNLSISGHPDFAPAELLHYWHFNQLAGGVLGPVSADSSTVGTGILSYPGQGAGYMDVVTQEGGGVFNLYGQVGADALRVRNPANSRSLLLQVNTNAHHDLTLLYNHRRTNNGARWHRLEYFDPTDASWKLIKDSISSSLDFRWEQISLAHAWVLTNQDTAQLRFVFLGTEASGSSGNQRFDNLLITGKEAVFNEDTVQICSGDVHYWRGDTLQQQGNYRKVATGAVRDTVYSLHLKVGSVYHLMQSASICTGAWYVLPGGDSVHQSGSYIDTLGSTAGCDSIITTTLRVDSIYHWQQHLAICRGDSLQLPDGQWTGAEGLYTGQLSGLAACDTAWSVQLTFKAQAAQPHIRRSLDTLYSSSPSGNQWLFNGQPIPGATDTYYKVLQNGSYAVRVDSNGCWSEASDSLVVLNSSIAPITTTPAPQIYPNPGTGLFYIRMPEAAAHGGQVGQAHVEVLNAQGKQVMDQPFAYDALLVEVDLQTLAPGLYFFRLSRNAQVWFARVVKID